MGHELISDTQRPSEDGLPPWLDALTRALVADIVAALVRAFPDLCAVLLYGSVARHEERPVDDEYPSDVDLLVVFGSTDDLILVHRNRLLSEALGPVFMRHLDAPREVQVMLASRTLAEWDPTYVENVARDGIVLFARGPLPDVFARPARPAPGG